MRNKKEDTSVLEQRIKELEIQLIEIAESNGNIILKQLPNGEVELNGKVFDNTTDVEYFNAAKATYGELTMFRVGVETKDREMKKLIQANADRVDELILQSNNQHDQIKKLNTDIDWYIDDTQKKAEQIHEHNNTIKSMSEKYNSDIILKDNELIELEKRYNSVIKFLEKDIQMWKERYLTLNTITTDGTILTQVGEITN